MSLFQDNIFDDPATKRCRKCGKRKPFTEFYPDKRAKDGRTYRCRVCLADASRIGVPVTIFPTSKKCNHCKAIKNIDEFYKRSNMKDGHQRTCKKCHDKYLKELNKLPHRKAMKRIQRIRHAYKMQKGEYEVLLNSQEGKCAICDVSSSGTQNTDFFFVDHDHKTGKVRGLLCHHCNSALGNVKDSVEILAKAILYLDKYRGPES